MLPKGMATLGRSEGSHFFSLFFNGFYLSVYVAYI